MAWIKTANARGPKGDSATVTVGTVTGSAAGTAPTVINSGTAAAAIFDFTLPAGAAGPTRPELVVGSNAGTAAGYTLWVGTAAQYAAAVKDNQTVYVVTA